MSKKAPQVVSEKIVLKMNEAAGGNATTEDFTIYVTDSGSEVKTTDRQVKGCF